MISQKKALAKYFWNVLKNRSNKICSNEIRSNEIRIRQGSSVLLSA